MSAVGELPMPDTYIKLMLNASPEPNSVLAGADLSIEQLTEGNTTVKLWQQIVCLHNFAASMPQRGWHLDWVLRVSERFHGPISAAWLSAPTLGHGLDVFVRYSRARIPYLQWQPQREGSLWRLGFRTLMDFGDFTPLWIEIPVLVLGTYLRTLRGGDLDGVRFEFGHAPQAAVEQYEQAFSGEFRFNAERPALFVPTAMREFVNPDYDELLWQAAVRRCEASTNKHADAELVRTVVEALHDSLDTPWSPRTPPTLDDMAAHLNVSTSTLNRRFRAVGTTYQAAVDDVRRWRAREMLTNPRHRVGDIALALGYNDPAAFVRSFKRWYGTTPGEYRRRELKI